MPRPRFFGTADRGVVVVGARAEGQGRGRGHGRVAGRAQGRVARPVRGGAGSGQVAWPVVSVRVLLPGPRRTKHAGAGPSRLPPRAASVAIGGFRLIATECTRSSLGGSLTLPRSSKACRRDGGEPQSRPTRPRRWHVCLPSAARAAVCRGITRVDRGSTPPRAAFRSPRPELSEDAMLVPSRVGDCVRSAQRRRPFPQPQTPRAPAASRPTPVCRRNGGCSR